GHFAQTVGSPYLIGAAGPLLMACNLWFYDRPVKEDWQHSAILELIAQDYDRTQPFMLASVLSDQPYFFPRTLVWSAIQKGIDLRLTSTGDGNASFVAYVIIRPGDQCSESVR